MWEKATLDRPACHRFVNRGCWKWSYDICSSDSVFSPPMHHHHAALFPSWGPRYTEVPSSKSGSPAVWTLQGAGSYGMYSLQDCVTCTASKSSTSTHPSISTDVLITHASHFLQCSILLSVAFENKITSALKYQAKQQKDNQC